MDNKKLTAGFEDYLQEVCGKSFDEAVSIGRYLHDYITAANTL
jgi:hypothetical protein